MTAKLIKPKVVFNSKAILEPDTCYVTLHHAPKESLGTLANNIT